MKYITTVNDNEFTIEIVDRHHVIVNGVTFEVDFAPVSGQPVFSLLVDGKSYEGYVHPDDEGWQVLVQGTLYPVQVEDERERRLRSSLRGGPAPNAEFHLKAPMPGLVVAVQVGLGQEVAKGDVLVVLESMKMQNELKSPRDGKISRIRIKEGDRVEQKQALVSVI